MEILGLGQGHAQFIQCKLIPVELLLPAISGKEQLHLFVRILKPLLCNACQDKGGQILDPPRLIPFVHHLAPGTDNGYPVIKLHMAVHLQPGRLVKCDDLQFSSVLIPAVFKILKFQAAARRCPDIIIPVELAQPVKAGHRHFHQGKGQQPVPGYQVLFFKGKGGEMKQLYLLLIR